MVAMVRYALRGFFVTLAPLTTLLFCRFLAPLASLATLLFVSLAS